MIGCDCQKTGEPPYPLTLGKNFAFTAPRGIVSVWGRDATGKWGDAGLVAPRAQASWYALNISGYLGPPTEPNFTLKLIFNGHHLIDFVGLDDTRLPTETWQQATLVSASYPGGASVMSEISADDMAYAHLAPGESILLSFASLPSPQPGTTRDFVLFTKGYFYPQATDLDARQQAIVGLSLSGSAGALVSVSISEDAAGFGERGLNVTRMFTGGTSTIVVPAYGNRSYAMILAYVANGPQSTNTLSVNLTFSGRVVTFTEIFNTASGLIQVRIRDLNNYLRQTLTMNGGTLQASVNQPFAFEPVNLLPDRNILTWSTVMWNFGDGTSSTTHSRTVTKSYGQQGLFTISATITYAPGIALVLTRSIQIHG